jgi:Pyruvate/2-oxoacid:ferredoxin oxidoreductase gamma subunit
MVAKIKENSIIIPREAIHKKQGVVILDLEEYKEFLKYEMEKEHIDEIVNEGIEEEKQGKTESLEKFLKKEYPKLYENYKH